MFNGRRWFLDFESAVVLFEQQMKEEGGEAEEED